MEFSLQYESIGADIHATLRNGGLINYVTMPEGWWMTAQIANAPKVPHETEEGKIKVPVWWFLAAFQDSFWIIIDEIDGDKYAADCVIHAETLAFNADTAMAENWHLDEDGEPKYWITVEAFAHDFGKYSEKRFKAGTDVAPVTVYEEDIINIPNQAFPPPPRLLKPLGTHGDDGARQRPTVDAPTISAPSGHARTRPVRPGRQQFHCGKVAVNHRNSNFPSLGSDSLPYGSSEAPLGRFAVQIAVHRSMGNTAIADTALRVRTHARRMEQLAQK